MTWWGGCMDMQPTAGPYPASSGHCPLSTAASSRLCGAVTGATATPWTPTPAAGPSCWTVHWLSLGRGTRRRPHGSARIGSPALVGLPLRAPRAELPQLWLRVRHYLSGTQSGFRQMASLWGLDWAPHLSQAFPQVGLQVGTSGLLEQDS